MHPAPPPPARVPTVPLILPFRCDFLRFLLEVASFLKLLKGFMEAERMSTGRRWTRGRTGGLRPRSSSSLAGVFVTVLVTVVSLCGRGAEGVSSGGHHSCSVFDDGTVKVKLYDRVVAYS